MCESEILPDPDMKGCVIFNQRSFISDSFCCLQASYPVVATEERAANQMLNKCTYNSIFILDPEES